MKYVVLFFAFATNLFAYQYEELNRYEDLALKLEKLIESTEINTTVNVAEFNEHLDGIINQGINVMQLVQSKKPECKTQYDSFIQDIAIMPTLSFDEVHKKYHDGVGLPSAPKYCYLGRSQVVHPVLSKIILKNVWSLEVKEELKEETEEILEHLNSLERMLSK